jgi:N-acetylglucosamine-6-phosphate deacetylase
MAPLAGGAPGPVGAALADRSAYCGIIVDGHHVSDTSLKVALAARGTERTMLVTDAAASVGSDLASFTFGGKRVTRQSGRLTTADGTLAGSDLDMASAVRNTVRLLGVPLGEALRMASLVPAAFLGLHGELGRIAPGYRADLVLLDEELQATATWVAGAEESARQWEGPK